MSLSTAQQLAWTLATSLMACITLFKAADGYGVLPTADFDGPQESIVHEYDPFDVMSIWAVNRRLNGCRPG